MSNLIICNTTTVVAATVSALTLVWSVINFFINNYFNNKISVKIEEIKIKNEKKIYITKSMFDIEIEMFKFLSSNFNDIIYSLNFLSSIKKGNNKLFNIFNNIVITKEILFDFVEKLENGLISLEKFIENNFLFLNNAILISLKTITENPGFIKYKNNFVISLSQNKDDKLYHLFLYNYILENFSEFETVIKQLYDIADNVREDLKNYINKLEVI